MLAQLNSIAHLIGNTPLRKLNMEGYNLFAKLEYNNYSGSIKDRASFNIIRNALQNGDINKDTLIVESSSGNFAISLASICKVLGLKFIPVIDPNINQGYESLLRLLCNRVTKVSKPDATNGYLLTRIETVKEMCVQEENVFWTNQYENVYNYQGYYQLGKEIERDFDELDYVFVAVSSAGTVTGLSQILKMSFPKVKIVAVDVVGSVIFGGAPGKRFISGLGASKVPPLLPHAIIDEVIYVSQSDIIESCHQLLNEQMIFAGASTGAVYHAIKKYFSQKTISRRYNVLFFCADKGSAYMENVYNAEWVESVKKKLGETHLVNQ